MNTRLSRSHRPARDVVTTLLAAMLASCSDEARVADTNVATSDRDLSNDDASPPNASEPTSSEGAEPPPQAPPLYALLYLVWNEEGPTGYIATSHSLELTEDALANAREFPGYISMRAVAGQLLVASGEAPTITRYAIGDDLSWTEGDTLSFANYGVPADAAGFFEQFPRDDRTVYARFDVSSRVIWDPTDLVITTSKDDSALALERDGLQLYANFNRSYFASGTEIIKPFSYHDEGWFTWAPDTLIAVYDPVTHEERTVIDAPCPGLDTISRDETGRTYLSTWDYSTMHALAGSGAAPCVVRLLPDNSVDPTWNTDLTSQTGGRLFKNFRYLGNGKAVAAVLDAEMYGEDFDFNAYLENVDDFWTNEGRYHRYWLFDVEANTAAPVSGVAIDFVQPAFFHAALDGRFFLFATPGDTNQSPGTIVHELALDGTAKPLFNVAGDVLQWVRIR